MTTSISAKLSVLMLGLIFSLILFFPATALAANKPCKGDSGFLGLPTWYKYIIESEDPCVLKGQLDGTNQTQNLTQNIPKVLLAVFEIIMRIAGMVAVAMVIYGGTQYIISQGEPDKIKGARTTIINAIVGMVIAMMAVTIVNVIGRNL